MTEEEGKGFKVTDRRRFNADGEVRDDAREDPPARPAPPSEPLPRAEPPPRAEAAPAQPSAGPSDGRPSMDFLTFIASLATNALAAFGMLPEEQAKGLPVNPDLGREYIEILGMLADKTEGNLTPEEDRAFKRILSDLRMAYVEISKRGAP